MSNKKVAPLEERLWELFHAISEDDEVGRTTVADAIQAISFTEVFADHVFHKSRSAELRLSSDDIRLLIGKELYLDDN